MITEHISQHNYRFAKSRRFSAAIAAAAADVVCLFLFFFLHTFISSAHIFGVLCESQYFGGNLEETIQRKMEKKSFKNGNSSSNKMGALLDRITLWNTARLYWKHRQDLEMSVSSSRSDVAGGIWLALCEATG